MPLHPAGESSGYSADQLQDAGLSAASPRRQGAVALQHARHFEVPGGGRAAHVRRRAGDRPLVPAPEAEIAARYSVRTPVLRRHIGHPRGEGARLRSPRVRRVRFRRAVRRRRPRYGGAALRGGVSGERHGRPFRSARPRSERRAGPRVLRFAPRLPRTAGFPVVRRRRAQEGRRERGRVESPAGNAAPGARLFSELPQGPPVLILG
ncbi:MAG: hypothetical protein BWY99_02806 [Synergistetes bacterium ADurb.BinA166]|nr:MAG: hypothetical protein BWY99_02806 [Synergistetes bacterium ADurb.BinA166]